MRRRDFLTLVAGASVSRAVPDPPRITRLHHISFHAHDPEAARAFYTRLLGFQERFPGIFWINNRQELILRREREPGTDRLLDVGFETDDAERLQPLLKAKGLTVSELSRSSDGGAGFGVADPDGHALWFFSPSRTSDHSNRRSTTAISTDLRHAGILVGSLSAATHFYNDILGFKEIWRGSRNGTELDWVNVQVPNGDDYIEFMLYRDLPPEDKRGTQHHICLFLKDLDKTVAVLTPRAGLMNYSRPLEIRTGTNRKRQLNLFDPDGTRVELMEDHTVDGKPAPSATVPPPRP
jgi:catechol 2,3-dioxygenase-like lactoylglutathione lyase family enzyme